MMRRFELFILLSFAVSYFVRVFEFGELVSHFGPFPNYDKLVKRIHRDEEGDIIDIYEAPVTLIDEVRARTPMNPYHISDNTWMIDNQKMWVWECPKCLSPYVAAALTVPVMLFYGRWQDIPLMWAAVTGGGYFVYSIVDYLYRIEISETVIYAEQGPSSSDIGDL
jgi:hypothetical protein